MFKTRLYFVTHALPLLLVGCIGQNDLTEPDERRILQGSATIIASTSGTNPDTDGYTVSLDELLSAPLPSNGSHTFTDLAAKTYQATLAEIAPNCSVQGSNPQTFTVAGGSNTDIVFTVTCA